jgi:hypothetical protein
VVQLAGRTCLGLDDWREVGVSEEQSGIKLLEKEMKLQDEGDVGCWSLWYGELGGGIGGGRGALVRGV